LNKILKKISKDASIIADNKSIELQENDAVEIHGDYSLLLQMFRAVVENGIKYTSVDGKIIISLFKENNKAVVEISDDGIGIPEKDINKIFDSFYRVDKGRDREKGGTGLGLSLVKQIAELHNGKVKAESVVGKGTTMRFIFEI
jgi:two-component system sensor histidine kinase VicK